MMRPELHHVLGQFLFHFSKAVKNNVFANIPGVAKKHAIGIPYFILPGPSSGGVTFLTSVL